MGEGFNTMVEALSNTNGPSFAMSSDIFAHNGKNGYDVIAPYFEKAVDVEDVIEEDIEPILNKLKRIK